MARQSTLVMSYLASARAASPTSNAGRLAWLEERRATLSEELEGGDWEMNSASFDGSTSAGRRHATAETRLEAVMEAIDTLNRDPSATRPRGTGLLIPRFSKIPHA